MMDLLIHADVIREATQSAGPEQELLQEAQDNLSKNDTALRAAKLDYEKLVAAEQKDNLKRILDGESAAPPKLRRLKNIQSKKSEIDTRELAVPILGERIEEALRAVQKRKSDRSRIVYPLIQSSRLSALDAIKSKVAECVPLIIDLAAHEQVQTKLLGSSFRVPAGASTDREDFDAMTLALAFLSNLPPLLCPSDDDLANMDKEISAAAANAVKILIGDE